jgi:hypothetical protein
LGTISGRHSHLATPVGPGQVPSAPEASARAITSAASLRLASSIIDPSNINPPRPAPRSPVSNRVEDGAGPSELLLGGGEELRRFLAYFTSKRLVAAELLKHSDADDPVFGAGYARVLDAGRPLLLAAQASGETRSALTLEQILDMVAAIAKIPGDTSYREPILQAALDSLRTIKDA